MDTFGGGSRGERPRAALFGGAFNPLHKGHLALAEEIERRLGLAEVIFIPTGLPPHKERPEVTCEERVHMVELAIAGRPGWRVVDIECRLPGPSLTSRTLTHLSLSPPPFFVMGEDAFADFLEWGGPEIILSLSHLVIVTRPGAGGSHARDTLLRVLALSGSFLTEKNVPSLDDLRSGRMEEWVAALPAFGTTLRLLAIDSLELSSTRLRSDIASGSPERWAHLLPEPVKSYIVERGLYKEKS
ncbi:MAG: nicotinate (nicotinamide) nucleotide adenylyltransferase [Leptospirillia bacterium]